MIVGALALAVVLAGAPVPALIVAPPGSGGFHIQFTGPLEPGSARVVEVDGEDATPEVIAGLRSDGRYVICYTSAGSWEDWRTDAGRFPADVLGRDLDGWPGERWLDIRDPSVLAIMADRVAALATKGCQGVEFDNVDGYTQDTGFRLTRANQLRYNRALAGLARQTGLSPGLKNAVELAGVLAPAFDWALNEECVSTQECDGYRPFVRRGKPVFVLEYGDTPYPRVCRVAARLGLVAQVKNLNLDAYSRPCPSPA